MPVLFCTIGRWVINRAVGTARFALPQVMRTHPDILQIGNKLSKNDKTVLTNNASCVMIFLEVMHMTRKLGPIMNEENMFTVLRAATIAAGVAGTLLALWLGAIGVCVLESLSEDGACVQDAAVCVLCIAVLVGISGCCYAALVTFFRMCGRLAKGSAFTEENGRAMQTMARLLCVCAGLLLVAILAILLVLSDGVLPLPVIFLLMFLCAFAGAGLIAHALALLVRRAAALQQESELTI